MTSYNILRDVITYPCPWYLFLARKSPIQPLRPGRRTPHTNHKAHRLRFWSSHALHCFMMDWFMSPVILIIILWHYHLIMRIWCLSILRCGAKRTSGWCTSMNDDVTIKYNHNVKVVVIAHNRCIQYVSWVFQLIIWSSNDIWSRIPLNYI